MIRDELPSGKTAITCIGPAGEHLVPYACLLNERRALGRGGAGAVMGSKNVKALVVREGPSSAPLADEAAFKSAVRKANEELRTNPFTSGPLKLYGSVSTVAVTLNSGIMPADNWQRSAPMEEGAGLLGEHLRGRFLVKDSPCGNPCPSRCSKVTVVREGPYAGAMSEGPEYETVYALGSSCGIYDLGAVIAGRPDVRPAGSGHDFGRRDDRVRHGVFPARPADPRGHRWHPAPIRQCRRDAAAHP